MGIKVVISNSNLNSYGGRVLTSGIDITQYKRNPILLYMHMRADEINYLGGKNPVLGTVENIAFEGDNLVGELKFSESNPFAKEIEKLYEEGTMRMVSPGLRCVEWSDDGTVLLPGQTNSTLTKSKLREVSCCDLGSNDDALRLYDENDKVIELKSGAGNFFPAISINENKEDKKMKDVFKALNLKDDTEESVVLASIEELKAKAAKADELEAKLKEDKEKSIAKLVDKAIADKKFTADKREIYLNLGKNSGIEALETVLADIKPVVDVAGAINIGGKQQSIELTAEQWDKMDKAGTLIRLKNEDIDTFKKLYQAKFGKELK